MFAVLCLYVLLLLLLPFFGVINDDFKFTQQADYYLSTFKDITDSIVFYFIPVFRCRNLQCNIT